MADPEVRFPETYVSGVPVWARRRKRSGMHPIVSAFVLLLALFGAVVIGASLRMGSVEKGGAVIDGWIAFAHKQSTAALGELTGEPTKVKSPDTKVGAPDTVVETQGAKVETPNSKPEATVTQSGRKGGRYEDPTESSTVAESSAAR